MLIEIDYLCNRNLQKAKVEKTRTRNKVNKRIPTLTGSLLFVEDNFLRFLSLPAAEPLLSCSGASSVFFAPESLDPWLSRFLFAIFRNFSLGFLRSNNTKMRGAFKHGTQSSFSAVVSVFWGRKVLFSLHLH